MQKIIKNEKLNNIIKVTKKVFFWLAVTFCLFLVIVAGWLCIDKFIIGSKVPSFCGFSSLFVETGSMSGTIEENEIIIIKRSKEYKIGDIITFIQEGDEKPTTHRIIGYGAEGEYITKGDANPSDDSTSVKEDEILGKVIASLTLLSLLIGWATEGGGYIYIIAIILVVGVGTYFMKIMKEKENDELEEETKE